MDAEPHGFSLRATEALVETLTARHSGSDPPQVSPFTQRDWFLVAAVRQEGARERESLLRRQVVAEEAEAATRREVAAEMRGEILRGALGERRAQEVETGLVASPKLRCRLERGALEQCLTGGRGVANCGMFIDAFESCAKRR